MLAPAGDPEFLTSRAHGLEAQLATLRKVVPFCVRRRTAVDVGAHIGTWTVGLLPEFERVYAFEPQTENFACLKANAGQRALVENVALSNTQGAVSMVRHGFNSGCWAVATDWHAIGMTTLDAYALHDVDFMKIDVEGYEGRVILGAAETIRRSQPVVFFEDNNLGEKLYGADWVDPKEVLIGLGYTRELRLRKDELWLYRGEL